MVPNTTTSPSVPDWDNLTTLPYSQVKELWDRHQPLLDGPLDSAKPLAGLYLHRFLPGFSVDEEGVLRALDQMVAEGSASARLVEEAKVPEKKRVFSRQRRYNTGSEISGTGEFVEVLYRFPSGAVRVFCQRFVDPAEVSRRCAVQGFVEGVSQFAKSRFGQESEVGDQIPLSNLHTLSCRKPVGISSSSITNLYLDAVDEKTFLERSGLEDRVAIILDTTRHDLNLHAFSQEWLKTREGKNAAALPGTWRTAWRPQGLFGPYDEALETVEEIILEADQSLQGQMKKAGLLDKKGKLRNGSARMLYANPEIAGVLEMLDIDPADPSGKLLGFSMGDLNPGNVMVYENGKKEFVDFKEGKLAPVTTLLFERWARAGLYGPDGNSLVFFDRAQEQERSCEEALLDYSFRHLSHLPGHHPVREEFIKGFQHDKIKFLLRLARRYKKYETVDEDPQRMQSLKRFYYSWCVKELTKSGKVSSPQDKRLSYLSTLFEEPLSEEEMAEVFKHSDPAFCYRSELSPVKEGIERKLRDDISARIRQYQRQKRWQRVRRAAMAGIAAIALPFFGFVGYQGYLSQQEIAKQVEQETQARLQQEQARYLKAKQEIEGRLAKINRDLKEEKVHASYKERIHAVRMYHNYHGAMETVELLSRRKLEAWIDQFWFTEYKDGVPQHPDNPETRQEQSYNMGRLKTAYAAFIDWETTKEGILATQCSDWDCALGEWINKKGMAEMERMTTLLKDLPKMEKERRWPILDKYSLLWTSVFEATYNGIDSFARAPNPDLEKEARDQTRMVRNHAFGLGHTCKPWEEWYQKNKDVLNWSPMAKLGVENRLADEKLQKALKGSNP